MKLEQMKKLNKVKLIEEINILEHRNVELRREINELVYKERKLETKLRSIRNEIINGGFTVKTLGDVKGNKNIQVIENETVLLINGTFGIYSDLFRLMLENK